MDSRQQVKQFFSRYVEGFDAHYEEKAGGCDRVLRKSMFWRQALTIELLGDVTGKRILDVGIGTGRLAMALLRGGAQVTGVDFAPQMLATARERAKRLGVNDKLELVEAEFMDAKLEGKYDACVALGYYDYQREPLPHLKRMSELAPLVMASFPVRWHILSPQRWVRYRIFRRCYLRYYSLRQLKRLAEQVRPGGWDIYSLGRDYLVHLYPPA
jgi:SAM-dependent methyltransferase